MIEATINERGNLILWMSDPDNDRADILDLRLRKSWHEASILQSLMESYWTNNGYYPFDAGLGNPFVGLTGAPCIAESIGYDDEGDIEVVGRLWWYPNYQVRNCLDDLLDHGVATFTLAPA